MASATSLFVRPDKDLHHPLFDFWHSHHAELADHVADRRAVDDERQKRNAGRVEYHEFSDVDRNACVQVHRQCKRQRHGAAQSRVTEHDALFPGEPVAHLAERVQQHKHKAEPQDVQRDEQRDQLEVVLPHDRRVVGQHFGCDDDAGKYKHDRFTGVRQVAPNVVQRLVRLTADAGFAASAHVESESHQRQYAADFEFCKLRHVKRKIRNDDRQVGLEHRIVDHELEPDHCQHAESDAYARPAERQSSKRADDGPSVELGAFDEAVGAQEHDGGSTVVEEAFAFD